MSDDEGGYGRPPRSGRFQKGKSGNAAGRPPGSHRQLPYETIFARTVPVRGPGGVQQMNMEEAFLQRLTELAAKGNNAAARAIELIRDEHDKNTAQEEVHNVSVDWQIPTPGSVNGALELLRMAKTLDGNRETARLMIEPWLVEAALARLEDRRLSREDQKTVVKATRTPRKVRWPDWWEEVPA